MTQKLSRLLVVGGNGFIGQHVVKRGVLLGWDVTSLNRSLKHLPQEDSPVRHLVADTTNLQALAGALGGAKFDYVVNCSGEIDHTLFFKGEGRRVLNSHFLSVLNLTELINRDALQMFVNIGSSDEYGNSPAPQVETAREAPISPYSIGKVAATHFLQMLSRTENFPATTLRLFLTYGPGQDNRRFIPQIVRGCLEGRIFSTSKGEQLRDFCYIDDIVNAIFTVLANPAANGQIFNVASGEGISIRHMIETIVCLIGKGQPQFGEIPYRVGENMALYANISKVRSFLNWTPCVSLESGLEKTIQWIREQS
ncbi:MAG: NAD-dependent epimerase/dehydratase family protein [Legionella sp.]|nr:NAD-dependent epimerase/dehydratase family protein [Legionella sp.]